MAGIPEQTGWFSGVSNWFRNAWGATAGGVQNAWNAAAGGIQNAWGAVADPRWRNEFMRSYQEGMGIYGDFARAMYEQVGASTGLLSGVEGSPLRNWWSSLSVPRAAIGRVGYFSGIGTPLLAGAAAFSGLNNLRRGRYGRGLLHLAIGAGLVGAMYGASLYRAPFIPRHIRNGQFPYIS